MECLKLTGFLIFGLTHSKNLPSFHGDLKIEHQQLDLGCPPSFIWDTAGSINSPNYPSVYPSGITCNYRILASNSNQIQLNFSNVALPDDGQIKVYDGVDEDSALILTLNSTSNSPSAKIAPNPYVILSTSYMIYVKFIGGSQLTAATNYGFNASFNTNYYGYYNVYTYKNSSAMLTSPNYPRNYLDSDDRIYQIATAKGTRLQLRMLDFVSEEGHDFLRIVDGNWIGGQLIGQYSGTPTTPFVINASSNAITLYWHTDAATNYRGWAFIWSTI